nr:MULTISPECIES: EAL domain-containing protein [Acaryochloris]
MGGTQILMIEDDDQDVEIVRELLDVKHNSVTLQHSRTLSSGIKLLNEFNTIDVVLLDLSLTDTQGLSTFHRVHQAFPTLPLIILSGNADETIALEAMQEGAQDYLVKGRFNSTLLARTIQYALERQKQQLELQYKNLALQALSEQLEIANHELEHLATFDGLTRVNNRRKFDQVFQAEWQRLMREGRPLSLILCDVDHFKAYNDTHGHPAGDRCLQQVARAIAKVAKRPADCVARYGGEEFVVVLPNTDRSGAVHVAEAIRAEIGALQLPHEASSVGSYISLSFGVASLIPNEDVAPALLIEAADQALYAAKEHGRNRVYSHAVDCLDPALDASDTQRWVNRLQLALDKDHFRLYAQPIQRLNSSSDKQYFEILLRLWEQPGVISSPGLFLPMAEQYDFMTRIDHWVIDHLFADLHEIKGIMQHDAQFFINLSSSSCRNNELLHFLSQRLVHHDLQAEQFCFEITETVASNHISAAAELSRGLKDIGCKVALDDFGNGLSSFLHLKSIPADYVKIDGSFVKDIAVDPVSIEIVGAVHRIAKRMGLETIAEYVESQAILDSVSSLGIDYAQGHYYDPAQPLIDTLVNYQSIPYRQSINN